MRKECTMWCSLGRGLLVVIMGVSLGGCAGLQELCGTEKEQQQIISAQPQPQPEVKPAPAPPPPAPAPPKKARN